MQEIQMGDDQIKKEPDVLFNVSSTPFGGENDMAAQPQVKIEPEEKQNEVQGEAEAIGPQSGAGTVIQVTNISPGANVTQMATLFGFLGAVEDCKLYPSDENVPVGSKICYVKYVDPATCGVAQHLTNTVFIDRALIVVPQHCDIIPDEATALQLSTPSNAFAGSMPGSTAGLLPTPQMPQIPVIPGVLMPQQLMGLNALGVSAPPSLTGNIDPSKVEEIRRTVYVGNLDATITAEQLLAFFSGVGEIKYVRLAGEEGQPTRGESTEDTRFAFIEFSDMSAVATALQYNGVIFGGRPLKVNYSKNAIVKPETDRPETVKKENDKAMRQVRELEKLISGELDSPRRRSRSRSRSRRHSRSRSRSRDRRRRSRRSRTKSRSPSYSRRRRSRTRSRSRDRRRGGGRRRKSFSRSKSRSRSRSPSRSKYNRYSRDRRERSNVNFTRRSRTRSRTRSPERRRRTRSRSADKDRSKKDKDGSRSPSRSPSRSKKKYRKDKDRERDGDRSRDRSRERSRDRDRGKDKDKEKSKEKSNDTDKDKDRDKDDSRKSKAKKESEDEGGTRKDVDRIGGDSDMSLEEDEDTLTKKKSRGKSYDSGGDSPKKKKKGLKKNAGSGSDFSD